MKICVAGEGAFGQKYLEALKAIDGVEIVRNPARSSATDTAQAWKKIRDSVAPSLAWSCSQILKVASVDG
jgi:hypothetical protein